MSGDGLDLVSMSETVERARLLSSGLGRTLQAAKDQLGEMEVATAELAAAHATFDSELSGLADDIHYGGSV